jgi:hypothetical protein
MCQAGASTITNILNGNYYCCFTSTFALKLLIMLTFRLLSIFRGYFKIYLVKIVAGVSSTFAIFHIHV